ncbi:MAG: recombinase family protein [Oscillospiraceae bacterium]|nr:recombinase family protein [Oscillospiraceae bacterium]
MNIAAYCRVSTNKEDQLNSLETQKAFFEEYAKKNNFNLIRIYADEGISGTKTKNRVQFLQLMKDCESKIFEMVVAKDISRLARNAVDFLQGIRYMKSKGIACNFVNANLTSHDSEMVLGTLALVAQEESANTSKRIKMSKKINAEKGRVPNIVYGYDKTIGDSFNLTINQKEADIVKRIYHLYTCEGYGANKIACTLNSEGIKTKRNCLWSQNAIARILTNEIYVGKIINGKEEVTDFLTGVRTVKDERDWIIIEKSELRIINDKTFQKAGEILSQRCVAFNIKHERQSNKHLFSTLIKCKDCGYSFRRRVRTYKHTYIDWLCSGRSANGADTCVNKVKIFEIDLINAIEDYFLALLKDKPNILKNIKEDFNKQYKTKNENIISEQDLKKKLKKLGNTKQKYMDMYEDELISREEMRKKIGEVNADIKMAETELIMIEQNINKGDMLETILSTTFKSIESVTSLKDMTNAQIKQILEKIEVDKNGNVDIYLKMLSDIGLEQNVHVCYNSTSGYNNKT